MQVFVSRSNGEKNSSVLGDYRWHGGTEMNVMEMIIFLLNTSTIVASGNFQHLICVHSGVIVVFNYEVWWIKFLLLLILKKCKC